MSQSTLKAVAAENRTIFQGAQHTQDFHDQSQTEGGCYLGGRRHLLRSLGGMASWRFGFETSTKTLVKCQYLLQIITLNTGNILKK